MSIFDKTVITKKVKRTKFNLSHQNLLTCNMGELVPIFCKEVVPGDTFSINANTFIRFAPMLKPIFSNIKTSLHFWYVPNRLVWKDWDNYITGNDPNAVAPYFTYANGVARCSLADYMGVPANTLQFNSTTGQFEEKININPNVKVSALPFRAYDLIWNSFYKDEELQTDAGFSMEGGYDTSTLQIILHRAWKKDYFTSARPHSQYGDAVSIPLGDSAQLVDDRVIGNGNALSLAAIGNNSNTLVGYNLTTARRSDGFADSDEEFPLPNGNYGGSALVANKQSYFREDQGIGLSNPRYQNNTADSDDYYIKDNSSLGVSPDLSRASMKLNNKTVDLTNATSVDIFKLRTAFQMQKFLELTGRAGNRIKEYLKAHFGVSTSDARLQLPEFLGGSTNKAIFSEVLQTSESSVTSPQGNQSGHGLAYDSRIQVNKKFIEEHGFIIGLLNVQPDPAYCQGLDRQFTRESRFDYGLPAFQNIGEQAILQKEIYAGSQTPDAVFGYAPRYSEYKSYNNQVHGDFMGSKDIWHMARIFDNDPQLNDVFIWSNPTSRVFASDNQNLQKLNVKIDFNIVAKRPFQYFSNPGISTM